MDLNYRRSWGMVVAEAAEGQSQRYGGILTRLLGLLSVFGSSSTPGDCLVFA